SSHRGADIGRVEDDLTYVGAFFHICMCLSDLCHGEDPVDDWRAKPLIQQWPDFPSQVRRDLRLLRLGARAHHRAGQGQTMRHEPGKVNFLSDPTFEKRDQYETPIHAEASQVAL